MQKILLGTGIGVLAVAWAWLGPIAPGAFFAHMTMHMAVVAVAAPLIALGLSGSAFDPVAKWPRLLEPVPLSIAELIIVWSWHAPALHHAARHSMAGFVLEQGMFLTAGFLVWVSSFGGGASRDRAGAGVIALLLTSMHMTLLGALLALTPRPLYAHHEGFKSLSALADQQFGGAIMILAGGASYLVGGLWLSSELLRERTPNPEVRT